MVQAPSQADVAEVLEMFGYPMGDDARESMLCEMRDIESAARRLMRTPLRPQEHARAAALAEASNAAQAVLAALSQHR
ncbi:hypothetical protein [Bordetella genomosp. 11]|uniref:Uncharacterized protein n=1 Tax=Bordetella genomosp. 11 TaxID=1416808 RepID=A0A261UKC0_9BORD|nr:hypothetical protein [Bordetella genomosp. 11]OZI62081.1 hypothetical protein CAL28_22925 [Bordetella genomosp. 11]